jgi:integrase
MGGLTATEVRTLRTRGKYRDGHGLLLNVVAPDQRYWMFRYRRGERERTMSLGNADVIGLAEARRLHTEARALLARGIDPLEARRAPEPQRAVSFDAAAASYIEAHRAGWRGRTEEHWRRSLAGYVSPVFGAKPVGSVTTDDVLRALQPIWADKTVTAVNLRSRIELVLDYARARRWRPAGTDNPAVWRGNLKSALPPPARVHRVTHQAALGWASAPALMTALAAEDSMAARCLRFLMLTAVRSSEARGARWDELTEVTWTIPAGRIKGGHSEHRVPLCEASQALLGDAAEVRTGDVVFPGRHGGPIDSSTLPTLLRRLGYGGITVHGMRSTFADWAAEHGHRADLAEMALAHTVGSAVRRAYQRSDLLEQRRALMQAWGVFLTGGAEVVRLVA